MRPINTGDLDNLHGLYSDAEVMKYSQKHCKNKAETAKFLDDYVKECKNCGVGQYAIFAKNTGEFVGRAGNCVIENREYKIAISYFLHKKFWGQGFGAEISRAICVKTFDKYDKIGIAVMPGNTASEKLAKKLGSKFDREIEINVIKYNNFLLKKEDFYSENSVTIFKNDEFLIRSITKNDSDILRDLLSEKNGIQPSENFNVDESISRNIDRFTKIGLAKFLIFDLKTSDLIGLCGFHMCHNPCGNRLPKDFISSEISPSLKEKLGNKDGCSYEFELGYRLKKSYCGKGIATKISNIVLNYAFEKYPKLNKIIAYIDEKNLASKRVLEKNGFNLITKVETQEYGMEDFFVLEKCNFKQNHSSTDKIRIFTTRPDTLFGASFVAISPNHPIAGKIAKTSDEIREFIEKCNKGSVSEADIETREKEGIFTGLFVDNPAINIAKAEGFEIECAKIPVWIANFVLMDYGTGAIFGCPAHDERDFEFAKKYNLPIKNVVAIDENIVFETEKFYVKKFIKNDYENLLTLEKELWNNDFTPHNNAINAIGVEEFTRQELDKFVNCRHYFSTFAIVSKKSREFVGKVNIDRDHSLDTLKHYAKNDIDLGYAILQKFQNQGIATEISLGALKYLENIAINNRIFATHKPENVASQKVLEKTGFTHIGKFEANGGEWMWYEFCKNILTTQRLKITPSCQKDAIEIEKMYSNCDDAKFFTGYTLNAENDVKNEAGSMKFTIRDKENGNFIGRAQLSSFENEGGERFFNENETEVIYFIAKEHRGCKYSGEILDAICDFAFSKLGKKRLVAVIDSENKISEITLKKCGFKEYKRGNFEKYGSEIAFILEKNDYKVVADEKPMCDEGFASNSYFLDSLVTKDAKRKMIAMLEKYNVGEGKTTYRLKDWGVSRQRYWGCPIPVVYCENCGVVCEKAENLPILLPDDTQFDGKGNPLANHPSWKNCKCPKCGKNATRETDTLDTFVDSSWYFARYLDAKNTENPFDQNIINYQMPVDQYIGGAEHAVLHLLYARFFTKALYDMGYLNLKSHKNEPFTRLLNQGMVLHETYKDEDGKYVFPSDVFEKDGQFFHQNGGKITVGEPIKMSKSKKNVINPDDMVEIYGADSVRLFVLSDSPVDKDFPWSKAGINGAFKYINKLYKTAFIVKNIAESCDAVDEKIAKNLEKQTHKTIAFCKERIENFGFNKTIAKVRELHNMLDEIKYDARCKKQIFEAFSAMICILSPIIPHLACEIAEICGFKIDKYPDFKQELIVDDEIIIAVQINGKLRGQVMVNPEITQNECLEIALANADIAKYVSDKSAIKKVIFIKGKILSIVI
nr:GNAT family N-acetyltransferase [Candidatus Deianiraea vastatrix]